MPLTWLLRNVNSPCFAFIDFVIENRFLRRGASTLEKVMSPKAEMDIIIVNDKPSTFLNILSFIMDATVLTSSDMDRATMSLNIAGS